MLHPSIKSKFNEVKFSSDEWRYTDRHTGQLQGVFDERCLAEGGLTIYNISVKKGKFNVRLLPSASCARPAKFLGFCLPAVSR